jgi:hypothetical protein
MNTAKDSFQKPQEYCVESNVPTKRAKNFTKMIL